MGIQLGSKGQELGQGDDPLGRNPFQRPGCPQKSAHQLLQAEVQLVTLLRRTSNSQDTPFLFLSGHSTLTLSVRPLKVPGRPTVSSDCVTKASASPTGHGAREQRHGPAKGLRKHQCNAEEQPAVACPPPHYRPHEQSTLSSPCRGAPADAPHGSHEAWRKAVSRPQDWSPGYAHGQVEGTAGSGTGPPVQRRLLTPSRVLGT